MYVHTESKNRSSEKNVLCRWICKLKPFLNREFTVLNNIFYRIYIFLLQDQGSPVTAVTVKLIPPSNEPVKEGQLISLEMTKNGVQKSDGVSVGENSSKVSPCSSCDCVAVVPSATGMYTASHRFGTLTFHCSLLQKYRVCQNCVAYIGILFS